MKIFHKFPSALINVIRMIQYKYIKILQILSYAALLTLSFFSPKVFAITEEQAKSPSTLTHVAPISQRINRSIIENFQRNSKKERIVIYTLGNNEKREEYKYQ